MSTRNDISLTYNFSNEFFRLWLDSTMSYSCGLFYDDETTLEQAQVNKMTWFYTEIGLTPASRVLDLGCGWGGLLNYLHSKGLKDVTSVTLSEAQYDELQLIRQLGIKSHLLSYKDFQPDDTFDAVLSIGMFEHLASPTQARQGTAVEIYRDYFQQVWRWTRPFGRFGLQSVITLRIPRDKWALKEIGWTSRRIFPGASSPRVETIISSASPYWEVTKLYSRREHYQRTASE